MKKEVLMDIKMTLEMIDKKKNDDIVEISDRKKFLFWAKSSDSFSKISQCYSFSNENLREYYDLFNMRNKKVLTVCGSGDQVLSAVLKGAKKVDTFDSNKLAYYNLMLKKYAIENLSYEDFIKFYTLNNHSIDRTLYYNKIIKNVSESDSVLFWNSIFENDDNNLLWCYFSTISNWNLINKRIPYVEKKNYNLLKDKLVDYSFNYKNIDMFQINKNFKDNYDFINLSNICQYVSDKEKFIDFVKQLSNKNLNKNGSILLNYIWNNNHRYYCDEVVYEKLNALSYPINEIAIYDDKCSSGEIKVYTKKSK